MADNELFIYLRYEAAQAEASSRAHHAGEQQRIRQTAQVQDQAEKEASAARKKALNEAVQMARQVQKDLEGIAKGEVQSAQDTARAKASIAADFARADKRSQAELNADFRRAKQQEVTETQQALRKQTADKKQAFREWKQEHENNHKLVMMQWEEQQEGAKKVESGIMGVAQAYTALRIASLASQGIHQAMQAVGDAVKEANDHVKEMVDNMEKIRDTVQELASLRNKENGSPFTAEVAREAESTGSTTKMHVEAQKTFLQYANQYVGTQGADAAKQASEAKEGKTAFAETQELEQFAETSSNAQGINPSEGTRLMATVLSQRKPGQTKDDLKLEWRKLMENVKQASGPTGPLVGKLNELIMEEVSETGSLKSAQEAAVLIRGISEVNPAKAFTYGEAIIRGNREIRADKKGQMEELGITRDMTQEQMIQQAMKRSEEIAKEEGEGITADDVLGRYYKDARGLRGISGAINKGIKGGRFEAGRRDAASVTLAGAQKENQDYLGGRVGTKRRQEAASDRIDAVQAEKYEDLREMQREYANRVKQTGKLQEKQTIQDQATEKQRDVIYGNTRAERMRDQMMGPAIESELRQSPEGRKFMMERNIGKDVGGRELGGVDAHDDKIMAESLQVLKSIRDHAKAQVRQVNPPILGAPKVQGR